MDDGWFGKIFSGDPSDLGRVGWQGVALMVAGLILALLSEKIAVALRRDEWNVPVKLVGVTAVALGALIATRVISF